jgi:hypothetical protein
MSKFFCECVNRTRVRIERRCRYEIIKFNDSVRACDFSLGRGL